MLAKVSLLGRLPGTEQGTEILAVCGHPVYIVYIHSSLRGLTLRERLAVSKSWELPGTLKVLVLLGAGLPHS